MTAIVAIAAISASVFTAFDLSGIRPRAELPRGAQPGYPVEIAMRFCSIFVGFALLALPVAVEAHPKLISATARGSATPARRMELRFSEKLMPQFSGADLVMVRLNQPVLRVPTTVAVSPDGHTLILRPQARLGAGRYSIAWHVVSVDTHRVAGSYSFAVR
jgi:copper resistance protein C